ncbi:mitochondrial carrier [Colletotrichum caudatum]|nr:mitochondrial carrier [Colletotrichum caudatum]
MAHSRVHLEFMSATGDRPAARHTPDITSYPVSRENGDIIPDTTQNPSVSGKESPFAKSWVHFVAGGIGGMTAATLTAPLDVLKTRLQSDFYQAQLRASHQARSQTVGSLSPLRAAIFHLRETFQILGSVYKIEGPRALFKGLGPNLVGVIPARSINFYTYGNGKRLIAEYGNGGNEAAWVHLSAGVLAGVTTSTVTNPIWLVKTRLQLDKNVANQKGGLHKRQYRNSVDCIGQVLRTEGFKGLYKGMSASYLGVAESTLQWVLYEQIKNRLAAREERIVASGREKNFWDQTVDWMGNAGAAGGAKLVAAILAYPHEVARTRLRQAPLANGQLKYTGLWQCFRVVWIEEGFMGLYGGLTPHLMRTVPSAAIMFGMYEGILRIFGAPNKAAASL